MTFEDEEDLTSMIDDIYMRLDEDESGGLNFEEFRQGVKQLSSNIHLTRDDVRACLRASPARTSIGPF